MQGHVTAMFASVAGLTAALAQGPASVLDGVYTHAQAERGHAAYEASCAGCHEGQDADGPELVGKVFLDRWREDKLESLFTFIKTAMPGNAPGSLDDRVYTDIIALILEENGLPAGATELTPDRMGSIQLVGAAGPSPLANLTIVRAVGCLEASGDARWVLSKAGSPAAVRSRIVDGTTPDELKLSAAQSLGTQSFPLLSVTEQSRGHAGHKVQVKGVLTRQNAVDRINVMSITSLSPACGG
jgi:mono/diheme cytochrome c family protein